MRFRSLFFVAGVAMVALMLTGCKATETIQLDTATDSTFAEINDQGQRQQARVQLVRRPPLTVAGLRVTPDSTFWLSPRTGRELMAPTMEVQAVQFRKSRAWQGAVFGAAIGVGIGLALGQDCSGRDDDETCIRRIDLMPMGALVGGILGALFGARGSIRYQFDHTPSSAIDGAH